MEPSESEKVDSLLEFTAYQLSREEAKQLLKISSNAVDQAVEKFWAAGDVSNVRQLLKNSKSTWDESAFGANRYGEDDNSAGGIPTFNIDYAPGFDNYPHSDLQSGAPSRPPSRTSQRSNHLGDPIQSIENNQESGVIGNSKPIFGPANRDYYDDNKWALVPTTSSTEYIPDPIPSMRQREEGQPAILKPSPNFNYLPALIAILHSIPLFRNALLATHILQDNYWMGNEWWKGNSSAPARTIDAADGAKYAHELDIIFETQRLIAFLDNTDRVYATIENLLQLEAWKESQPQLEDTDDDLLKFLLVWSSAYENLTPDITLNGALRSMFNAGGQIQESFVLDTTVVREGAESDLTLYDVLDQALFSTASGNAHIVDISNVLILRLTSSKTDAAGLGCKIPATFYADRYLEKNKSVIDAMFLEMQQYENQLKEIDEKVQKLKYHTPTKMSQNQPVESLQLIKTSIKAFQPAGDDEELDPKDAAVLSQLQSLYESIENKLAALDEQKKQLRETLDSVSDRFKAPIDTGETLKETNEDGVSMNHDTVDHFEHPYKLRGVATRRDVVYLLSPDIASNGPDAEQWWRVYYSTELTEPYVKYERLSLSEVIKKACSESASALLVYANDAAISAASEPLPAALEEFAKRDKLNFLEELQLYGNDQNYGTNSTGADDDWRRSGRENPPGYDDIEGWNNVSTHDFHAKGDSGFSSTTLTPNTEHEDEGVGMEMVEVNGGMNALMGVSSSASSDTIGESMDVDERGTQSQGTVTFRDVEMSDAGTAATREEPRVQHIEVTEKRGE